MFPKIIHLKIPNFKTKWAIKELNLLRATTLNKRNCFTDSRVEYNPYFFKNFNNVFSLSNFFFILSYSSSKRWGSKATFFLKLLEANAFSRKAIYCSECSICSLIVFLFFILFKFLWNWFSTTLTNKT